MNCTLAPSHPRSPQAVATDAIDPRFCVDFYTDVDIDTTGRMTVPAADPTTEQSPNAPRSRKGAQTRARLIESAQAVFEETGFLEARISDIADRAGLSHGSFYHYFDSKEQIFREVAEEQEARLTAPDPDAAQAGNLSEYERILKANRRYLQRYRDNGKIMGVIEEVSRYDTVVNDARMNRQKHFAERAEQAIHRLQDKGVADPTIDPAIAAVALGSMVGRFSELWIVEGWADYDLDVAAEQLTKLWANALGLAT
jgi:AcrR family transcriptional regulator